MDLAEAIDALKPDVVVFGTRPGVLMQLSKATQRHVKILRPIIIVLADQPEFSTPKLLGAGADVVFHRSSEFEEVFKLVKQLARRE